MTVLFMLNLAIIEAATPGDSRKASISFILPFVFVAIVLYLVRPRDNFSAEIVSEEDMPKAVLVGKTSTN